MTADKVFILLLVILLPLTGCIDMTDNADASDPVDTPTMTETIPEIFSLHIEANANHTFVFDGNTTLRVESFYHYSNGIWNVEDYNMGFFDMTCNGTVLMDGGTFRLGHYLPALGGQDCSITFFPTREVFMFFSEATLASL